MNLLASISTDTSLKFKVFIECPQAMHIHRYLNADGELHYHKQMLSEACFAIDTPGSGRSI